MTNTPIDPRTRSNDEPDHHPFHSLDPSEVTRLLSTDRAHGLSSKEARDRLDSYGPNEIEQRRRTPPWKIFASQFQDFMIYVLVGAVIISAIEGQVAEAVAILAILMLNGVLGFVQEYRAEQSLEALKELSALTATVIRDGAEQEVAARDLVPGDVVLLEAGDKVPADGRLLETGALGVTEAALTGESASARKNESATVQEASALGDRKTMVYAGTAVAVGRGVFVVTATGLSTEMGRIASLLAQTEEGDTPLQTELERVGKRIALIVLAVAAIVFVEEVFLELRQTGDSLFAAFAHPEFRVGLTEGLLIAVSLAVAAIPEGLPAVVTVALSLGVRRMAEHHAIVRKLHAVETLGSTTFICSDKTGTLTLNRMTVRHVIVGTKGAQVTPDWGIEPSSSAPDHADTTLLLEIAAACNDAHFLADGTLVGDPTETALIDAASHLAPGHLRPHRIGEVPFDSERKRMTTVHQIDGHTMAYMKGGADVVLDLCTSARIDGQVVPIDADLRASLLEANALLASTGFRTLAFACRPLDDLASYEDEALEEQLTYIGIMGLVDPAREEVAASIDQCHRAGIKVAMVTGDHALTARAIASQIGLLDCDRVVTGLELARMTDAELEATVEDIRVYARVNPEDKLRIVDALKRNGEIVAMTGDGVNDSPALKRADIGVAMGLVGTDVARESADMILTDDNFATIVRAVREGRIVFANLRKVILFLLSCNMSEVLIVFLTALLSPTPALYPLQLLWINLVTDGPPALALGTDPGSSEVMDDPPRQSDESILTNSRQWEILAQGALMTVAGLIVFLGAGRLFPVDGAAHVNTMLFTAMVLVQKIHAFSFISETRSIFSRETLRNRWLNIAFVGTVMLQVAVVYWPPAQELFGTTSLGIHDWTAVLVAVLLPVAVIDQVKLGFSRYRTARREAQFTR